MSYLLFLLVVAFITYYYYFAQRILLSPVPLNKRNWDVDQIVSVNLTEDKKREAFRLWESQLKTGDEESMGEETESKAVFVGFDSKTATKRQKVLFVRIIILSAFYKKHLIIQKLYYKALLHSGVIGIITKTNKEKNSYEAARHLFEKREKGEPVASDDSFIILKWEFLPFPVIVIRMILNKVTYLILSLLRTFIGFSLIHIYLTMLWVRGLLTFNKEITNLEDKASFYDEFFRYDFTPKRGKFHFFIYKALEGYQFRKYTKKYAHLHPNLEVGFYNGHISGYHLRDIDYFDWGIELVKDLPLVKTAPKYNNISDTPLQKNIFKDHTFSAIYMVHIVDHFPDIDTYLKETFRIAKSQAVILLSGLSSSAWMIGLSTYNHCHITEWRERFLYHGFEIETIIPLQAAGLHAFSYNFPAAIFHYFPETKRWINKIASRVSIYNKAFSFIVYHAHKPIFLHDEDLSNKRKKGINFFAVLRKP